MLAISASGMKRSFFCLFFDAAIGLHFHGLTSYGQLNSFGAERQKNGSWVRLILSHDAFFFSHFFSSMCVQEYQI